MNWGVSFKKIEVKGEGVMGYEINVILNRILLKSIQKQRKLLHLPDSSWILTSETIRLSYDSARLFWTQLNP